MSGHSPKVEGWIIGSRRHWRLSSWGRDWFRLAIGEPEIPAGTYAHQLKVVDGKVEIWPIYLQGGTAGGAGTSDDLSGLQPQGEAMSDPAGEGLTRNQAVAASMDSDMIVFIDGPPQDQKETLVTKLFHEGDLVQHRLTGQVGIVIDYPAASFPGDYKWLDVTTGPGENHLGEYVHAWKMYATEAPSQKDSP